MALQRAKQRACARLLALDLDGTLLRADGSISASTLCALRAAQARGLGLLFVTARPPRRVRALAGASELCGVAICGNGSLLYDLKSDALLAEERLRADHASLLVESLRTAVPDVAFAVEIGLRYGCDPNYAILAEHARDRSDPLMRRADAIELCREGVTKLIVQQLDWPLRDLLEMTRVFASSRASVSQSSSQFVEVVAPRVDKASALRRYCAARQIAATEVIAFGDGLQDLPMLRWAGCGIAVANAHPEVLAAADLVTRSNDADGVALALDRLGYT
ncbi:MAG TPA: Cof-type HAD-IIB family hydrolase [Polyangiaceae bacterium]|nr:Cof-type HAD-IIB family hydrolase [Polyangiaceae bacterium]